MTDRFDVFLSYHWRDNREVRALAEKLRVGGLSVFLDRWYLTPGKPWPQELERVLATCGAVTVCIGPGEMGPWQQREMYFALERQAGDPSFPVIPVMLPGAQPALQFLGQNTWVDFRGGLDEPLPLAILDSAVRGQPPGPELQLRFKEILSTISPYRGLAYFREEDAPFFFGRDTAIATLVDALSRRNFVALVGASGSGKSSVVRAGLAPRLRRDKAEPWEIMTIVPNDRPLYNLASTLAPRLEPDSSETDLLICVRKQADALADGVLSVRDVVERIVQKQSGTKRCLLIVDQWEELYTLTHEEEERRRFIDELLEASATSALSVVMTLRGDYFGDALAYRPLSDRLQDAQANLGPMRPEELRLCIEAPALRVEERFEPGLVDRILADVANEPGNLPLLEFVMQQLWQDAVRHDGAMRHAAYAQMGGVDGALTNTAEATFDKLSERDQQAARRVFLQLVRTSPIGNDSRRRVPQSELGSSDRSLVKALADARLVVTTRDTISQEESVEVAHEALIRSWPRLNGWLNEDREYLLWRERLRVAIDAWLSLAQDEGALLRGKGLAEAEGRSRERPGSLTTKEQGFIAQSVALRQREIRQRRRRRLTIVLLFVLLTLFAVYGWLTRTININFPASTVEKAADEVIDRVLRPPASR